MKQYIKNIISDQTNDDQLDRFISEKKTDIDNAILNAWKEFSIATSMGNESETKDITDSSEKSFVDKSIVNPLDGKELARDETFEIQVKNKQITLPNGKVNQEYNFDFDIVKLGIEGVGDYEFKGLIEIGLAFDNETKKIQGIPNNSGEHKVSLLIKRNDWKEGKPQFEREITL